MPIDEYDDGVVLPMKRATLLQTKGLTLVPIQESIPDYSRWLNDPEVVKYSELRHKQHSHESCLEYIRSFDQVYDCMWAIYVIGPDMHIGNITINIDRNNNVGQMGMLIGEKWAWGRKYGREAWGAVIGWATTHKVRQIEAGCMSANSGMRRVAATTEMQHGATVSQHFLLDGKVQDKMIFRRVLNAL
jgi:[ribosomal protein S5]-alanine N-acetyltransferase